MKKKRIYLFTSICGSLGIIISGINAIGTRNLFIKSTVIVSSIMYIVAIICFYIDYKNSLKK